MRRIESGGRPGDTAPARFARVPPWLLLHFYLLVAFAFSALWASVSLFSLLGWSVLVLAIALPLLDRQGATRAKSPLPRPSAGAFALAAAMAAPTLAYLARSWDFDFPFLGDHNVHLRYLQESWTFWTSFT